MTRKQNLLALLAAAAVTVLVVAGLSDAPSKGAPAGSWPGDGALGPAAARPCGHVALASGAATGRDGWPALAFRQHRACSASPGQRVLAVFVRAHKAGESLLGGMPTRRLVSC